jgi:type II secretory pathway pseudopilin PulG
MVNCYTPRVLPVDRGQPGFRGKNLPDGQSGYTFLGLLFAVALSGIALAGTGSLWQLESRREKEKELLFIGEEYRQAIASYFDKTPGADKQYPDKLDDLLQDKRYPMPLHHLRRLYRDPMSPEGNWELIRSQGKIIGVASKAPGKPIKLAGFSPEQQEFEGAESYSEWRFTHSGGVSSAALATETAKAN